MMHVDQTHRAAYLRQMEVIWSQLNRMGLRARCVTSTGAGYVQLSWHA